MNNLNDNDDNNNSRMDTDILEDATNTVTATATTATTATSTATNDNESCSDQISPDNIPLHGCRHYLRKCKIIAPCCNKPFWCRFCHDEEMNSEKISFQDQHDIDRFKIKKIQCISCNTIQDIRQLCCNCGISFSEYFCKICRLYCDMSKKPFHCDKCGFCRIGGKEETVHCNDCNMCIAKDNIDNHNCKNIKESNCPICFEELFKSTQPILMMKCEHYIHRTCFLSWLNRNIHCPICSRSIIDLTEYNKLMEREVSLTIMPEEYKNKIIDYICNDCHHKDKKPLHIIGYKCEECGSFNTKLI